MEKKVAKKQVKPAAKDKKQSVGKIWLSPSQWGVWRKCALSVTGSSSTLKVEADEYASEGTDLHAIIARVLSNPGAHDLRGFDAEDEAIVRFAVDSTLSLQSDCSCEMKVEHAMKATFGNITIGGTADCLILDGDTIISIDHKTGWKEVEAEGNEQIKIYAHLAALENKKLTEWQGVIINARFNSTSYARGGMIEKNYLKSIAEDVKKRLAANQHATGYHCAYCPRLTTCAHIRKAIQDWMKPGAIDGLLRDPEALGEALKLAKPAEKLFETVQKEAHMFMGLGGVIPGVSIEYSPGNRTFPSDMTPMLIADKIGLDPDAMIDPKLITPAEALRRGADKDAVNAIVLRPPRKGLKFS